MEELADKLARYIVKMGVIGKEDYEIYRYGLLIGLEMTLCMAICSIIAIYLKSFLEFVVLIAAFFSLRAYVGGIHLKHFWACLLCSCLVITSLLISARWFYVDFPTAITVTIAALFAVNCLAPLATRESVNDREEAVYFAKQRKRIFILLIIAELIFMILDFKQLWSLIMYTVLIVLASMILGIVHCVFVRNFVPPGRD